MADNRTGRRIGHALKSAPQLEAINVQLQALAALDARVRSSLPPDMRQKVRVCNRQGRAIVLAVNSGATATRLRMVVPRLLRGLADACPPGTEIRIVVEVNGLRPKPALAPQRLGPVAVQSLGHLAASLPDSPLRRAVDRLVLGQRRSDGEDEALEDEKGDD